METTTETNPAEDTARPSDAGAVIKVEHLSKRYKVYRKSYKRLIEMATFGRPKLHAEHVALLAVEPGLADGRIQVAIGLGGVEFDDIQAAGIGDGPTTLAFVAGLAVLEVGAVHRLGQNPGGRGLPHPPRTSQQQRRHRTFLRPELRLRLGDHQKHLRLVVLLEVVASLLEEPILERKSIFLKGLVEVLLFLGIDFEDDGGLRAGPNDQLLTLALTVPKPAAPPPPSSFRRRNNDD